MTATNSRVRISYSPAWANHWWARPPRLPAGYRTRRQPVLAQDQRRVEQEDTIFTGEGEGLLTGT